MHMNIRNSLDGLKSLVDEAPPACSATQAMLSTAASLGVLGGDSATVSSAGSEVALTAADSDVRLDKVANIQAALASGTYSVPATEVASRMVDTMLENKH
jgi:negative regulator of flagellin synthesis FlgM